jgi:hypothetical protein
MQEANDMRALTCKAAIVAVALSVFALGGCEPRYEQLDTHVESSPPTAVAVGNDEFRITSGVAVVITASPNSGSAVEYDDSDDLELISGDAEVLEVLPGQSDREFAIVGVWPGETELVVKVNGEECDRIPFRCVAYVDSASTR